MKYTIAFRKALSSTWREKRLWIFGGTIFFFGISGETLFNIFYSLFQNDFFTFSTIKGFQSSFSENFFQSLTSLALLGGTIFFLAIAYIIYTASLGAMVRAVTLVEQKKSIGVVSVFKAIIKGKFLRLLAISILSGLFSALILLLTYYASFFSLVISLFFASVLAVILVVVLLLTKLSVAAVVIENDTLFEAIKTSFLLFKKHAADCLLLSVMIIALYAILGIAMVVSVFAAALPFLLIAIAATLKQYVVVAWIVFMLGILASFVVFLIFSSAASAFSWSSWVYMYAHLRKK